MSNPMTDDSAERFSMMEMDRPYSLLGECLASIQSAPTMADLQILASTYRATGSAFSALAPVEQTTVRTAWAARRDAIRTLVSVVATVAPVAPTVNAAPMVEILRTIVAESTPVAPVTRPARARAQSATAIATATRIARLAGSRLAGYDGRIVDPGQGLGTVISFGNASQEYDAVSGRMRQVLVQWSSVVAALATLGLPADHLGDPVTRIAHLGQASRILNHSGWIARNARNLGKAVSSWIVGRVDLAVDSDTLGDRECRIDLAKDGTISATDPDHVAAKAVIAEYEARIAGTMIESSDLRARIERTLVTEYGARSTDMGLYVSPYHAPKALDLIVALRPVAGRKIRAWSHTDRESISDALCDSFAADLGRLETDVKSKGESIKKLSGASLIERCERLRAECEGLASILGSDTVTGYKARILACDTAIVAALDDTSQRYAQMELT